MECRQNDSFGIQNTDEVIIPGENQSAYKNACHNANLSTTKLTSTNMELNLTLSGVNPVTDYVTYCNNFSNIIINKYFWKYSAACI
jgi:hypothetical protein